MKKNITINLCGRLFNIDEDAYELLNSYVGTLRNYFSRESDAEDIVADIEERISELFSELSAQGIQAINIEHVKGIINRIGRPEQFGDEAIGDEGVRKSSFTEELGDKVTGAVNSATNYFRGKRLYRNPKDKMVSGVVSGLAAYFGCDVTILRLVAVLLILLSQGVGLLVYIVMALVVPAAETPEQQLKMQGKPVNMSNLADEVVQDTNDAPVYHDAKNSGIYTILNALAKVFVICFKIFLGFFAFGFFVAGIGTLIAAIMVFLVPQGIPYFFDWETSLLLTDALGPFIWFLLALMLTLFIPVFGFVHYLLSPNNVTTRVVLVFVWIIAAVASGVLGGVITSLVC